MHVLDGAATYTTCSFIRLHLLWLPANLPAVQQTVMSLLGMVNYN
jgi:hypothetical protein